MAGRRASSLLLAAAAVLLLAVQVAPQRIAKRATPEEQATFDKLKAWFDKLLVNRGTEDKALAWNVNLGYTKHGERGLFASREIEAGEVIATIPYAAVVNIGGDSGSDIETTLRTLRELKLGQRSSYAAYLDTLPPPNETLCYCNFPQQYVPMLLSDYWKFLIAASDSRLRLSLEGADHETALLTLAEAVAGEPVTMEELRYACAVAATHTLSLRPRPTTALIPLFDLANHRNNCPITIRMWRHLGPDDKDLHLVANQFIEEGEEICYSYGDHREDYLMVYYGYVPYEPAEPAQLYMVDHRTFSFDYDAAMAGQLAAWPTADGPDLSGVEGVDSSEAFEEMQRLEKRLTELDAASAQPQPEPIEGWEALRMDLLRYQERRKAAIRGEMQRLGRIVAAGSAEKPEL